ncbi:MAG: hypothetical protein FWG65_04450 [Turicibacter sp.]|nr:hypothetical protein [Turicibacter sp.]
MRKILILLMIVGLMGFAACGGNDEPEPVAEVTPVATPEPAPEPDEAEEEEEEVVEEEEEEVLPQLVEFPPGVVYMLSMDPNVQELDAGTMGSGNVLFTPYLQEAGSPSFTAVEGFMGIGIALTNREENWHALDLLRADFDWDLDNNEYRLTVRGHVGGNDTVIIGGMDSPWNWLNSTEPDDNGNFTLSAMISHGAMAETDDASQFERGFRIQTNSTSNLTIYSIILERYIPHDDDSIIYQMSVDALVQDLAVGTIGAGNVLASPVLMQAGSPSWSIVEGPYGNAISLTNREETWHALDINRQNIIDWDWDTANNEYLLTVIGTIDFGGTAIVGGPDSPWAWWGSQEVEGGEVFRIEVVVSDETMAETGSPEQFVRGFRIQTDNTNNLTIHDIIITRQ